MHHGQEEVIPLPQVLLNAADDGRAVGVANLFRDNPDRVSTFVAQGAGKKIGPIVKFLEQPHRDAVLGLFGGMERAEGESLRTAETVPGVSPKCCATALRVTTSGFWPGFFTCTMIV